MDVKPAQVAGGQRADEKNMGESDITMNKHIACISCQFATVDESASDKRWMAYECSNPESEYHKSLLNVSPNGDKNARISWSGCDYAKRKVPLKHQEDIKAE